MIVVTKLDKATFSLNPDLVERIMETPDTIIIMVDGASHVVAESMQEVIDKITEYRVQVLAAATVAANLEGGASR